MPSSLLEIAKEFIDVFSVNLWDRNILRVILADVETGDEWNYFGKRHFRVVGGEKKRGQRNRDGTS